MFSQSLAIFNVFDRIAGRDTSEDDRFAQADRIISTLNIADDFACRVQAFDRLAFLIDNAAGSIRQDAA